MAETKKLNKKVLFGAWACHNKKWHTYQLWDGPLREKFREMVTFDPQEQFYKYGKKDMNANFLKVLRQEKPDYIFLWVMYHEFELETLIEMKKILPNSIVFCYNGDDDYKFENYTINYFPLIDYFMITQVPYIYKAEKMGKKAFFGCGADTKKFKPSGVKKDIDVSFVGTPKSDRVNYMRHLMQNGVNIKVYGAGWYKYPEFKNHYGGEIDEAGFIDVINRSKINICPSQNYFGGTHILERFFEKNACKSFVLTEYAEGYFPTFKEGKDIVTFHNKDDLLEKVKYYLDKEKERKKIAEQAYQRTIKQFSNYVLLDKVIEYAEKNGPAITGLPAINKTFVYLTYQDLKKGKAFVENKVKDFDYIGFTHKGYKNHPLKEYFQMNALELTKKPICSADLVITSSFIGDSTSLSLYYAYDYVDRKYFYAHLDVSQLLVNKKYLLDNVEKFKGLYEGKNASFINKENTVMTSLPLVKTKKVRPLPLERTEHILFGFYDDKLLYLRNQGRLFTNSYPYKLLIYAALFNRDLLKFIIQEDFPKSKIKSLKKIASYLKN